MALNAVMLTASLPPAPVPLPQEKIFIHVAGVQAELQAMTNSTTPDASRKALFATGTAFVTNKRVVFVADNASSLPSSSSSNNTTLRTLSVNLDKYQDGRFVQPWFAANYYEGLVIPHRNGGLDCVHSLKLHFKEGRAFEYYTALEEVKTRFADARGGGGACEEALPLYTPGQQASTSSSVAPPQSPTRDDVEAANAARAAEASEYEQAARHAEEGQETDGLPPAYDVASRPRQ